MQYLYHRVPENLEGDILYPLNSLIDIYPERYEEEKSKYSARPETLDIRVTSLNCRWNDVIHFTAVHPSKVHDALSKVGKELAPGKKYFQIDPTKLLAKDATIYLAAHLKPKDLENPENFLPYDSAVLDQYSDVPSRAVEYYEKCVRENERILIYKFIPHVLYRGNLDISDAPIITM
jgi:hypothetical protein